MGKHVQVSEPFEEIRRTLRELAVRLAPDPRPEWADENWAVSREVPTDAVVVKLDKIIELLTPKTWKYAVSSTTGDTVSDHNARAEWLHGQALANALRNI